MSFPILYPSGEQAFENNGRGILSSAVSCQVTEERNGSFELEMEYPVSGVHFQDLALREILLVKPNPVDQPQPFRIYRITKPLGGTVTVYAEHISYDLSGIVVEPFEAQGANSAMAALQSHSVSKNPFTFWTDKTTSGTLTVSVPSTLRSLLGGTEGSVLDHYGGEYRFDRFAVRLYGQRGTDRGVTIRYGKNLTNLQQEENCANVYTGVYPYWADSEGNLVQLPGRIVNVPGSFNFTRIKPLDLSSEWTEKPTAEQLLGRAQSYIQNNSIGVPSVSLEVSFIQLEQTEEYKNLALLERVDLCDTVTVVFPEMGISATAKVNKTVYDPLSGRYESVTLGDARHTIADTLAQQQDEIRQSNAETKTFLQKAVDHATQLITGATGGNVVLHLREDGRPYEILVMDTDDINTAVNVWRWNINGWGHSSSGYNGPYRMAATLDNGFVADFITTGTLNASLITAGILQSADGKTFYLDLKNGILKMQATELSISGQTVDQIAQNKANSAANSALNDAKDYADDAAQDAVDSQTQLDIFNRLTNNGATQGIYMKDGRLYLNATYLDTGTLNASLITAGNLSADRIYGGTLTLGRSGNSYGILRIMDSNGYEIGRWDNSGITATAGSIAGWKIGSGYLYREDLADLTTGPYNQLGAIYLGRRGFSISTAFRVNYQGSLNCYNAYIRGGLFFADFFEEELSDAVPMAGKGSTRDELFFGNQGFKTSIRGSSIDLNSSTITAHAAITTTSDERLKKDWGMLDKYEGFFDSLEPRSFRMIADGDSGKVHIGFSAQKVRQALLDNGMQESDLSALAKVPFHSDDPAYAGIDAVYGLAYEEFMALAIDQIQKLKKRVEQLESQITSKE